jgi:hypothetical protein
MPDDASDEEKDTKAGRPRSEIMDELTVELKSDGPIKKYRCAGLGCAKIFKPRTISRVLNHTKRCIKLTSEQRQLASRSSAATSPGARAEELAKGLPAAEPERTGTEPPPFFGAIGTKQVHDHSAALLDLAIVKLFCAAGLAPRLADYPEWKEVLHLAALAGRYYVPAGRTILMDNHIMSEQERVRGLQIVLLQRERRLTVSFDGGDLRSGEYFYTVHANTADGRSFLLEGIECTGVSHTAEWMANSVMEVSFIYMVCSAVTNGSGRSWKLSASSTLVAGHPITQEIPVVVVAFSATGFLHSSIFQIPITTLALLAGISCCFRTSKWCVFTVNAVGDDY